MEDKTKSVLPWIVAGVSVIALVMVLVNASQRERPAEQPKTVAVTNVVVITNTVVATNFVAATNLIEVTNTVDVTNPIAPIYTVGSNFFVRYYQAFAETSPVGALVGMTNIAVTVNVDRKLSDYVAEDDIRTRFELTLRKNGVPINSQSSHQMFLIVSSTRGDDQLLAYSIEALLQEKQVILRDDGSLSPQRVFVWESGYFGYAGTEKTKNAVLDSAQACAEKFANDYLNQNPAK